MVLSDVGLDPASWAGALEAQGEPADLAALGDHLAKNYIHNTVIVDATASAAPPRGETINVRPFGGLVAFGTKKDKYAKAPALTGCCAGTPERSDWTPDDPAEMEKRAGAPNPKTPM